MRSSQCDGKRGHRNAQLVFANSFPRAKGPGCSACPCEAHQAHSFQYSASRPISFQAMETITPLLGSCGCRGTITAARICEATCTETITSSSPTLAALSRRPHFSSQKSRVTFKKRDGATGETGKWVGVSGTERGAEGKGRGARESQDIIQQRLQLLQFRLAHTLLLRVMLPLPRRVRRHLNMRPTNMRPTRVSITQLPLPIPLLAALGPKASCLSLLNLKRLWVHDQKEHAREKGGGYKKARDWAEGYDIRSAFVSVSESELLCRTRKDACKRAGAGMRKFAHTPCSLSLSSFSLFLSLSRALSLHGSAKRPGHQVRAECATYPLPRPTFFVSRFDPA